MLGPHSSGFSVFLSSVETYLLHAPFSRALFSPLGLLTDLVNSPTAGRGLCCALPGKRHMFGVEFRCHGLVHAS